MYSFKRLFNYFSLAEKFLWLFSELAIIITFLIFDRENYLTLIATFLGVTALIYCAKGNPLGQLLMIIFGTVYAIISFNFTYYGETITYAGMTVPMSIFSLISWLKNPYKNSRAEVKVNKISKKELVFMLFLTALVTLVFYFVLKAFGTANLLVSTVSVTTSFAAVYLTFRRSPFFALGYALNDIVLIVLWVFASFTDISYISVVICFLVFLVNDLYGFISWRKMEKRQDRNE